jgi:hypothetical protein
VASRAQGPVNRFRLNNRAVLCVGIVGYYYDFDKPAKQGPDSSGRTERDHILQPTGRSPDAIVGLDLNLPSRLVSAD